MQEFLTNLLNVSGLAWWVEIKTEHPACTYYFGPFSSEAAALEAKSGYIDDLEKEGAVLGQVQIQRRRQPSQLTVSEELGEGFSQGIPLLSL
jgi:hypothetical protein